jgi:hypothetical protein
MEDLYQEVLDHQAEKERKKEEDRNTEAQLVTGGKQIQDRLAMMIVGGDRIVMGGLEVTLNLPQLCQCLGVKLMVALPQHQKEAEMRCFCWK